MRGRALLVLLTGLFLCAGGRPGAAQDLRPVQPVPEFPACRSTAHPRLPPHWRATYLMAPFTTGQLVVADIVHDASLARDPDHALWGEGRHGRFPRDGR